VLPERELREKTRMIVSFVLRAPRVLPRTCGLRPRRRGRSAIGALALALLSSACASTGAVPKPFPMPPAASPVGRPSSAANPDAAAAPEPAGGPSGGADTYALVGTALDLRGIRYRDGGSDPNGFDCSGFTQYVFARHGIGLPREVRDQFKAGKAVRPADVAPGDLLFFATNGGGPSHVAIAVGGDEFVHAPSTTGVVRVERLSARYWATRFLGARRITPP
jgi:cell wall-associated NlpC family hydrolase